MFDTITCDDVHPLSGDTPSKAVADTVHGMWVAFVVDGKPGWASYTADTRSLEDFLRLVGNAWLWQALPNRRVGA